MLQRTYSVNVQDAADIVTLNTLQRTLLCRLAHDADGTLIAVKALKSQACRRAEGNRMAFLALIKRLKDLQALRLHS